MRHFLLCLLILPFHLLAQTPNPPTREKLDVEHVYRLALRDYAANHPGAVYSTPKERIIFVKKEDYNKTIADTLFGLHIIFIDPAADAAVVGKFIAKKGKITILHMQQMLLREMDVNVWIMPMDATFNPKKMTLSEPVYQKEVCQYIYDYGNDKEGYLYKEKQYKTLED